MKPLQAPNRRRAQGHRPRAAILAAGVAIALGLGGCVTVFPKSKAAQLYRFDVAAIDPAAPAPAEGAGFSVFRAPTSFAHGSDSDRILTVTGDQVAYVAEARWIASAAVLFDEAESHAFDRSGGPAHLGRRGEALNAPVALRLDVDAFEARYLDGSAAPPTVVIEIRAGLTRTSDHQLIASRIFEARKKVAENRVGEIVPGFDAALSDVMGQIVAWTDAEGAKAKPQS